MLAYVNLAPDNGGIVLNVSEGGLGFQVVSAVQQLGAIPFWCSLAGNDRFEAVGELAWTDATRRTGGLRLTSAPPGVREQILNLAGLPPSPRPAPEVPMAQVHAVLPPTAPSASQSEKHVAPASDSIFRQITLLPETRVASAPRVTSSPVASGATRREGSFDGFAHTFSKVLSPRRHWACDSDSGRGGNSA